MLTNERRIELAIAHLGETNVENCGFGTVTEFARAIELATREQMLAGVGMEPVGYIRQHYIYHLQDPALSNTVFSGVSMSVKPQNDDAVAVFTADQLAAAIAAAKAEQPKWFPIETAPKSRDCGNGRVEGIYIIGFCPDADTCNLESAVCVVWWEPLMKKGAGMWYGEGGYETHPTHWMPLPPPPSADAIREGGE